MENPEPSSILFGAFELDLGNEELRKDGQLVRLQPQPLKVLALLARRADNLVTRDEIRRALWDSDTFVDFEHGLNYCIHQIRAALDDSAESPRYIETKPRHGYRFIAPVELPSSHEQSPRAEKKISQKAWISVAVFAVLAVTALIWLAIGQRSPSPQEWKLRQLTGNPAGKPVFSAAISPAGNYLAYSDQEGLYLQIIATGETLRLPLPEGFQVGQVAWFPDGTRLVYSGRPEGVSKDATSIPSLWSIPVVGGAPRKLRDEGLFPAVSPDGSLIAFTAGGRMGLNEVWVMGTHGENARLIAENDEGTYFLRPVWSPSGQRLAYLRVPTAELSAITIESRALDGGEAQIVFSSLRIPPTLFSPLYWTRDGRILFSQMKSLLYSSSRDLWEIRVHPQTGKPIGTPRQITNWPGHSATVVSMTVDGERLGMVRGYMQGELYIGALASDERLVSAIRRLTENKHDDWPLTWTRDGQEVIFVSNRRERWDVFKQDVRQPRAELLVSGVTPEKKAELSPDGEWLLYWSLPEASLASSPATERLMRVPLVGGSHELVAEFPALNHHLECSTQPNRLCVLSQQRGEELVFYAFDPVGGQGKQLGRVGIDPSKRWGWDLTPDGEHIALVNRDNRVRILTLRNGALRELEVETAGMLEEASWSPAGKSLIVMAWFGAGEFALLQVDKDTGHHHLLLRRHQPLSVALVSPDGRHLLFAVGMAERNVWLIENF